MPKPTNALGADATPSNLPASPHECQHRHGCGRFLFEDGAWRCDRCWTDADYARVDELDERGEAVGIDGLETPWPYGPNIDIRARAALVTWAEANRLEYAGPRHACLSWLRNGRCTSRRVDHDFANVSRAGWFDHPSCWKHLGRPSRIIAQPYPRRDEWPFVSLDSEWELYGLSTVDDLAVIVHSDPSWYGFSTVMIEIVYAGAVVTP